MSHYEALAKINVNDKVEKKNGLSYLSWAWAVDQLLRADPGATWAYKAPSQFGETLMVHCEVTAFGKAMTAHLPVMDHRNKAISNPDAFAVNTAMQRCLVKAIALHGLGLYIYAGEDLPESEPKGHQPPSGSPAEFKKECYESLDLKHRAHIDELAANITAMVTEDRDTDAYLYVEEQKLDDVEKPALWHLLDSDIRARIAGAGAKFRGDKKITRAERKAA
jgi:hypothetical protein